MRVIDDIKACLDSDADWGVYDGALSRTELINLVMEFEALERENRILRIDHRLRRESSGDEQICSSIY